MAIHKTIEITEQFLDSNPNAYFVFGDNIERCGMGGAAKLRHHPRAIGFITKKFPDNNLTSFYRPEEYSPIFFEELSKLKKTIEKNPNKIFYVSKLGAGLANYYRIWEFLICHNLIFALSEFPNVIFCWEDNFS